MQALDTCVDIISLTIANRNNDGLCGKRAVQQICFLCPILAEIWLESDFVTLDNQSNVQKEKKVRDFSPGDIINWTSQNKVEKIRASNHEFQGLQGVSTTYFDAPKYSSMFFQINLRKQKNWNTMMMLFSWFATLTSSDESMHIL